MYYFIPLLYLAFFIALLLGMLYALWLVVTDPGEASFFAWMVVVCLVLLGVQWLLGRATERLRRANGGSLPEGLLSRWERAGGGGEGTWISRIGFTVASIFGGVAVVATVLSGGTTETFAGTAFTVALFAAVITIWLERLYAFITDSKGHPPT